MFIEVFNDSVNDISIINSDYIKRFYYVLDDGKVLYIPKIETKDGEIYCLEESICQNEAKYIIDATIQQIKNPKDTTNKIDPYDFKRYYEEYTFLTFYDSGKIKNNEELNSIIEEVLSKTKFDGEEYDNFRLFSIAHKTLTPDQLELFKKALDEYKKSIDMINPTLSKYLW